MARNGASSRYLRYRRRRRNGGGTPRWLMVLVLLGALAVFSVIVLAGAGFAAYQSCISGLTPPDEAIAQLPQGGAKIYARDGETLLYQFLDPVYGRRSPVPLDQISPYLIDATIATEDASFWDNPGINVKGVARAAWENFSPFSAPGFLEGTGGSSITQQLVKNVYFSPEERANRTLDRKWREVCYSVELSRRYDKDEILEHYLNLIPYGNVYTGIEAASVGYFGKHASDLTLGEAALLAGIPASPSLYDPLNNPQRARQRQGHVLRRMYEEELITDQEFWAAALRPVRVRPPRFPVEAPHFVFNVVQPQLERLFGPEALLRDGLAVTTTLDLNWQREAERILQEHISVAEASYTGHNGALVAIDPNTAEMLVYAGSRDYFNDEIQGRNDMAAALNSPGSAFKPITYLTSLIQEGWGPGTLVLDTPITISDGVEPFRPCNPGGCDQFFGPITIREALGNSLNVPAVKAMLYAGVDEVIAQAKRMGITTLDRPNLGPALTTGGGDVRLVDMVYAFTVFPNLGLLKGVETELDLPPGNRALDPVSILRVEDREGNARYPLVDEKPVEQLPLREERVAPAEEAYLVTDILVDPNAECDVFGCGALSIPDQRPLAVKTGTSAPYTGSRQTGDTWSIASTPQVVAGSWYGNADNSPIGFASSTSVSWPITQEFMTVFHRDLPIVPFTKPEEGLVQTSVCVLSGYAPSPDCPQTTPEDMFPKHSLPQELVAELEEPAPPDGEQPEPEDEDEEELDDPLWERAAIDVRTGLLASDLTPPGQVAHQLFLQLPENLSDFELDQAEEWAGRLGARIAPIPERETTEDDIPVLITAPPNGAEFPQGTVVTITGRAGSSGFESYRLEFRPDLLPGDWTLIGGGTSPVSDGTLGVWNTAGLLPGPYTIRLTLIDASRGEISTSIQVVVLPVVPAPTPTPAPTATPPGQADKPGRGPPGND